MIYFIGDAFDELLQNNIPVFCPALTDGSIGDIIYFHSFRNPGFLLDIVQDIRSLNELSRKSRKAGMIVLGGGVCKHQIANAMLIVSDGPINYTIGWSCFISGMGRITLYTLYFSAFRSLQPILI